MIAAIVPRLRSLVALRLADLDSEGRPLTAAGRTALEAEIASGFALLGECVERARFPEWPASVRS